MEQRVSQIFGDLEAGMTPAEKAGRLDIKYRLISGKHVIVELKRAGRVVSTLELAEQIEKYRNAVEKVLFAQSRQNEPFEFLCVVGPSLSDWQNESSRERSRQVLASYSARVMLYDELMKNAYRAYSEFLAKEKDAGRLMTLIRQIDPDDGETGTDDPQV